MGLSLCGPRVKRWSNPEHLNFSFRETLSMISVPHRDIEWGEVKPRIEIDSSARRVDRPTLGGRVHGLCKSTLGVGWGRCSKVPSLHSVGNSIQTLAHRASWPRALPLCLKACWHSALMGIERGRHVNSPPEVCLEVKRGASKHRPS